MAYMNWVAFWVAFGITYMLKMGAVELDRQEHMLPEMVLDIVNETWS